MDESLPVAQEGTYPVRDHEHEKIQAMLRDKIDSDRQVVDLVRDRLAGFSRRLADQTPTGPMAGE